MSRALPTLHLLRVVTELNERLIIILVHLNLLDVPATGHLSIREIQLEHLAATRVRNARDPDGVGREHLMEHYRAARQIGHLVLARANLAELYRLTEADHAPPVVASDPLHLEGAFIY